MLQWSDRRRASCLGQWIVSLTTSSPPCLSPPVIELPLSSLSVVESALLAFLLIVFETEAAMKTRTPLKLTRVIQARTLILSSVSLVLPVFMFDEIVPLVWRGMH
ncbi:hypothetical protein B0H10DRAFT_2101287 [Mycena sp. CBHHK59/15]|nr:hypothetical protein B0H10DRAFT_2101287 [Mycena sp. CBHHK59/15]